ncbi:hypothetical protein FACS1894167_15030 [Synergistales bacterium]|nr:hypothetical protein FACS1894167_15030 [Synergistales bacterium]GHV55101.1 hypothetical protein FACS1894216_16580 [Synergistales bacterium]
MKEPEISTNFTIEDIHKIREYDSERRRLIGDETFWTEVHDDAMYAQERIKQARERRLAQENVQMGEAI